jgi:hypothetical protein
VAQRGEPDWVKKTGSESCDDEMVSNGKVIEKM